MITRSPGEWRRHDSGNRLTKQLPASPAIAVVTGRFCLWTDISEIDPSRKEVSIETRLLVYNVVRVRSQPGGAGTILNNLAALGVARIFPIGFAGEDGEGFELKRALAALPGVDMKSFFLTDQRRTFTYAKPLLISPHRPPQELNRLDCKNWTPTPASLQRRLIAALGNLAPRVDAIIVLDQVDVPETGVVTQRLLRKICQIRKGTSWPVGVGRQSAQGARFSFCLPENESGRVFPAGRQDTSDPASGYRYCRCGSGPEDAKLTASSRWRKRASSELTPDGMVERLAAVPLHGEIDVVGAGDSVTTNLATALAASSQPP